jgi:hypothetical protein
LQQTPFRAFLEGLPDFERVPNRLKQLVYRLTENEADQGVSLDFVLKELEMAAAEVGNAKQDAAISTHRKTSRGPSVEGYANLIDSMLDAVLANMEPERRDRLFPASPNLKSSIGYSHGSIGVARFLHFASGAVPHEVKEWVEREMTSSAEDPPGLYGGYAGVSWVAQELGWNEISDIALNRAWNHPKLFSQVDMYSGVCGVSLALLKRWVRTGSDVDLTRARLLADWIMETVDPHSPPERVGSGEIQDDVHYLGFAHGRSGLSLLMLYMGLATNDPRYIGAGQHYLNFDLHFRVGVSEGRYSSIPNYIGSSAYHPYWYSGTAGVLMTAFRYYAYEPSRELLNIVHSMIPDVARNFTFTPGLHYGLAGLGSCLMDGEKFGVPGVDWCSAVRRNIESVRLYGVEQSRGVSFPGDHLVRLSHDISTGNAGIGMYMLRMLREDVHPHFEVDELLIP